MNLQTSTIVMCSGEAFCTPSCWRLEYLTIRGRLMANKRWIHQCRYHWPEMGRKIKRGGGPSHDLYRVWGTQSSEDSYLVLFSRGDPLGEREIRETPGISLYVCIAKWEVPSGKYTKVSEVLDTRTWKMLHSICAPTLWLYDTISYTSLRNDSRRTII